MRPFVLADGSALNCLRNAHVDTMRIEEETGGLFIILADWLKVSGREDDAEAAKLLLRHLISNGITLEFKMGIDERLGDGFAGNWRRGFAVDGVEPGVFLNLSTPF